MNTNDPDSCTAEVKCVLWRWSVLLVVIGLFALWATWRMHTAASRLSDRTGVTSSGIVAPVIEHWTCTMHPEVQQPGPGRCPKCNMELVPKYAGSDEPGLPPSAGARTWYKCTMAECNDVGSNDPNSKCPVCGMKRQLVTLEPVGADTDEREIVLGERARRLAELATEPVARRRLFKRIRTVGKVTYDETRYKVVSAWTGGRIDRLFADYTGMVVKQGDHLVEIYSPDLLSAQEELLQAQQAFDVIKDSALESSRRSAERLVVSAQRKLELLGVTREQIDGLKQTGKATTHLVIHAPLGGTIVRKAAIEGMYVKTGDVLYEIADLTHVWLLLDLYEADLPWIQPFQQVHLTAESLPGEAFDGRIVFVDPVVDKMTRTIKVRVNVDNPQRRLKPEMFVTAEIHVPVAEGGRAAMPKPDADHACPMHPWEQTIGVGQCPICEMNTVPVESLSSYFRSSEPGEILSVPREAVMKTGRRALVYVEAAPGRYRGVVVEVGPLADDESARSFYPILSGLDEGQPVVTRGNFVIDSQMQIAGKPSLFHARGLPAAVRNKMKAGSKGGSHHD